MGLGSIVELTCNVTIIAHMSSVILQHAVLGKKMHEVHMRYLASDIHANILA